MKKLITLIILFFQIAIAVAQPKLSSLPSAKATLFLDFDGQYVQGTTWNGGKSFYCEPSGLTEAQITEVFHRVSEDYRPFNINITTDSSVYLAAPLNQRMRIIVTPTSDWYKNVGGVSFTRSFTWGDGTPAFVFPDRLAWSAKNVAECCSHEGGHTLGLSHQARYNENCTLVTTYNEGIGSGEIGWAPVMGNSYGRNVSGWNNGPTPSGCTADQDNLSIITGINGFTYREDDHSNDPQNAPTKIILSNDKFDNPGIITTNSDKDAFELDLTQPGRLVLNARPFSVGPNNEGANLDIQITLLNSNYETIKVYNPSYTLSASIDTGLSQGKYFVILEGSGSANFSNYGSLGSYSISGSFTADIVMPVSLLQLKGNSHGGSHQLSWDIVCDEKLSNQELQASYNGRDFGAIASLGGNDRTYNFTPNQPGDVYYRLKVTTASGQSSFSNIIVLKQTEIVKQVNVSSMVRNNQLQIAAAQPYTYMLADMNGKILKKGNSGAGYSVINMSNSPNGIYVIQITCNSQRIIERIVKL